VGFVRLGETIVTSGPLNSGLLGRGVLSDLFVTLVGRVHRVPVVDGWKEGWVTVLEVSPVLIPVDAVDGISLVRRLTVEVRERSRGTTENRVVVRGEVTRSDGRAVGMAVRERIVGALDRVVVYRVEGTVKVEADRGREVTSDRGDGAVRIGAEARERVVVAGGDVVRGLEGALERIVGDALRELGATREREGAGEPRDGVDALSSSLPLPRPREDAATPATGGTIINAATTAATVLFIFPPSYKTPSITIALQAAVPQTFFHSLLGWT
jgi:hypothetical protein